MTLNLLVHRVFRLRSRLAVGCLTALLVTGCTTSGTDNGGSTAAAPPAADGPAASTAGHASSADSTAISAPTSSTASSEFDLSTPTSPAEADTCPVTQPTSGDIPTSISEQEPGAVFGRDGLWVYAWWTQPDTLVQAADGGIRQKYPTWSVRDGLVTSEAGEPRVTVARIDGPGEGSGSVGGYATAQVNGVDAHWWPTVITVSGSGCWQVTESTDDDTITYVVRI